MIYLSAHESNHGVPSPFRKLDRKAHELYLNDRNQVSQRSKADIPPLWLNHMQFQETERIPEGYFLRHLPQCLMQSKSLPAATGTLTRTSRRQENFGWPGIPVQRQRADHRLRCTQHRLRGIGTADNFPRSILPGSRERFQASPKQTELLSPRLWWQCS